jgi:TOBE-like domain
VVGPLARLELEREDSTQIIEVELLAERARHLNLRQGETLLIKPQKMQVFVERGRESGGQADVAKRASMEVLEELPPFGTVIW